MAEDLRTRWEAWARRHVGPDERRIKAATDAAVRAARLGASSTAAAEAGRLAASTVPVARLQPAPVPSVVVGSATNVQQRTQLFHGHSLVSLTFRVAREDGGVVPVEMRGLILTGTVADGDVVEVPTDRADHGVIHPDRIHNRTTGSEVRMSKGVSGVLAGMRAAQGKRWSVVQLGCLVLALVVIAVAVVALFVVVLPAFDGPPIPTGP